MQRGHRLPAPLTTFIGREAELASISDLLDEFRIVTLTGPGGCGKTRLSLRVAASSREHYSDGIFWVDLAPLGDGSLVVATLAQALGVGAGPIESLPDIVAAHLMSRRAFVVLDNCEHLLDACATLAARIAEDCPEVTLLATSREPLGVPGEAVWQVSPMRLPSEESLTSIAEAEAVRLFVDRARAVRPSFTLTDANAPAVAEICVRLDGIPLAIELAAARSRVLTAQELAAGLADRFRLLTGGARWALPRQRTLEASLDWSHDLLDEDERAVFRRLATFPGSFTLDAAEAVCSGDRVRVERVLDLLSVLVDRSLVTVLEGDRAPTRYRLLETVRVYGLRKAVDAREHDAARARHAEWCGSFCRRAAVGLAGAELVEWLASVDRELDNVRAALDWTVESADVERGAQLVGLLTLYWFARSDLTVGRERLAAAIGGASASSDNVDTVNALGALCIVSYRAGDMAAAARYGDQAVALGRRIGDVAALGRVLHWRGWVRCWGEGDPPAAWAEFDEASDLLRASEDHVLRPLNLALFAWSCIDTSEASRARGLLDEALALTDAVDVPHARCYALLVRGELDMLEGELDASESRLSEALTSRPGSVTPMRRSSPAASSPTAISSTEGTTRAASCVNRGSPPRSTIAAPWAKRCCAWRSDTSRSPRAR